MSLNNNTKSQDGGKKRKKTRKYKKRSKNTNKCKSFRKYKKRSKNTNKCKSIRKGGMRRQMTNKMVHEYQNPHKDVNPDCCPCVFKLLGMPVDQVRFYQEKFGCGFSANDLVVTMKNAFPEYNHQLWESPDITTQSNLTNNDLLVKIFSSIPKGMGAIGGVGRDDNTYHCVAFAVTDDNTPMVFDAQAGKVYYGELMILNWLNNVETHVNRIYILNSISKTDGSQLIIRN